MVVEPLKTGQPAAVSCRNRTGIQPWVHRGLLGERRRAHRRFYKVEQRETSRPMASNPSA